MMVNSTNAAIALTVAGSDSGGGAGIQADLKTFHQFGIFGTSAVTAVTAQNTTGVHTIHEIPLEVVLAQIDAVVSDIRPAAFKTGMLATNAITVGVANAVRQHQLRGYVMDPVMVATSGDRLLAPDAENAMRTHLLPLATIVTPNMDEASLLTGRPVGTPAEMGDAARALVDQGAGAALVTGGHLDTEVIDIFWDGTVEHRWPRPRIETRHTHGTGCTLSAVITARLACGDGVADAVDAAVCFIHRAIGSAPGLGSGHGPVNHFAPTD